MRRMRERSWQDGRNRRKTRQVIAVTILAAVATPLVIAGLSTIALVMVVVVAVMLALMLVAS